MNQDLRLEFRRGDFIAIGAVVVLALMVALAFLPGGGEEAGISIYQDGRLIETLPLNENATLKISGDYENIITVQDGRVAITQSDCPGEDCVHSGWIERSGRSIVCLPNRVEVRIEGVGAEVDFIVG